MPPDTAAAAVITAITPPDAIDAAIPFYFSPFSPDMIHIYYVRAYY
jgi:hypothetical protein